MANRALIAFLFLVSAALGQTPTPTPPRASPAPTAGIFPISNGKLLTPLDANNFQIHNLDSSNLPGGGGGGGGGLSSITGDNGAATGLTLSVTSTGDVLTDPVFTLGATLNAAHGGTGVTSLSALKSGLSLDNVDNTSDLGKPISTATQSALNLKADSSAMTTALSLKADTSALALKENLLPTTSVNGYILSRATSGAYTWVDPVTLGTTSYNGTDGQSFTNTNYDSATANFVAGDVGLTITGTNIPGGTTIASRTSATRVVLSQATTGTGGPGLSFTIVNRLLPGGGPGTVTTFSAGNLSTLNGSPATLFTTAVGNASSTPSLTFSLTSAPVNTFFGNSGAGVGYMDAAAALNSLSATVVGTNLLRASNPSPGVGLFVFPRVTNTNAIDFRRPCQLLGDIGAESALTFNAPLARTLNTISIPQAGPSPSPAGTNGYLTAIDWNTFNSKVPPTRTSTATAPLRIGSISGAPGQDLSANRTLDMPASTNLVDGYLSATDHSTFNAKTPPDSTVTLTNSGGLTGSPA